MFDFILPGNNKLLFYNFKIYIKEIVFYWLDSDYLFTIQILNIVKTLKIRSSKKLNFKFNENFLEINLIFR